jgi:hypothetical protein
VVGRGYHIALTREHAKRLFGMQDDETLREFLDELKELPDMLAGGRVLESGILWDPIHRCLTEGELNPTDGDFPLNAAVLGGKQLHQGSDYVAALVRPDMTRFIADALVEIDEEQTRQKFFGLRPESYQRPIDEKHFMEVWLMLQDLKVFFEAAADNMEAVVFLAKYEQ